MTDSHTPEVWIGKYPMAHHYYAKINGVDVVGADGAVKWNTYEAAIRAVKRIKPDFKADKS